MWRRTPRTGGRQSTGGRPATPAMRSAGGSASASRRYSAGPRVPPAFARPITAASPASAGCSPSLPLPTTWFGCPSWWGPRRSHAWNLPELPKTDKINAKAYSNHGFQQPKREFHMKTLQSASQVLHFSASCLSCSLSRVQTQLFVSAAAEGAGSEERTAGDRTRRRRLNKLSCADWLPHDRGFVSGLPRSKDERR